MLRIVLCCMFILSVIHVGAQMDSVVGPTGKKFLLIPVAIKSIETNWGAGVGGSYFFKTSKKPDSLLRTSNFEALGLYTVRNQFVSAFGANVFFPGENYILRWRNSFTHFPDKFWGYGNYTPDSAVENYDFVQLFVNPQLVRKIYKDFYLGIAYELQHVYSFKYEKGGLFDQQNVLGKYGSTVSGIGFVAYWDSRNNAFFPDRGSYYQFSVIDFSSLVGSQFGYQNYIVDLRKFISIRKRDVLAFQFYSYWNTGNIPIRNMAILGGSDIMRGYFEGRFTDKKLSAAQVEYRVPVFKRFGVAAFLGYGEVFNKVSDFNFSGLKYSYGGGVRYAVNKTEKLNLRLDFGVGENSSGLYFTIRESF